MKDNNRSSVLIEIKDFYENLIAKLPGHIFWKDKSLRLLGCNDQQAIDFGYESRDQLIGKTNYELIWQNQPEEEKKRQADALDKIDLEVMKTGRPHSVEEPLVLPDGSTAIYISKKVPLRNHDNEVIGLLGIGVDITDVKKLLISEHEKDKFKTVSKAKSELLAVIGQKIRDPLNVVLGSLSLVEHLNSIDEIKACLHDSRKAAEKIQPMLQSVNEYLQLENGEIQIEPEQCEVIELIHKVIQDKQPACAERGNTIRLDVRDQLGSVMIDAYWLMNVFDTLLSNAIRFTQKGEITVIISGLSDQRLKISVCDTGVGFSKEKIKSVFNLYPTSSENINLKNFGIRLSITKKILELMGGHIQINESLESGAEVAIEVPYILNKRDIISPGKMRGKVLLVEDDVLSLKTEKRMLEFLDFEVIAARTAQEALAYDVNEFDMICIDINLPDEDGVSLCRKLKKTVKQKMPVFIAITAFSADQDLDDYFSAGFSELIEKPISFSELKSKILPLMSVSIEM